MEIKWVGSIVSQRGITFRGTQASLFFGLVTVLMAFSVTVSAKENQVNNEQAQMFITENSVQLDSFEEAFAQSRANVAVIRQIGDGNTNLINQGRSRQDKANLASIVQNGNYNDAMINQKGSDNTGLIRQDGNRHEANITQIGNSLDSQIIQNGQNSNVSISHSGSGSYGISIEQQAFSGNARSVTVETY
ncbi:hypothetical protein LPL18_000215 [Halomonas sp. CUBES01]|uniref:hypothetical protein n=1 Tax=Halomonas sp. CUBES01 TaxID=2897340 RepID=UPI001E39E8E8|nr:hypothetical protein [Halomonas sp. CUBES01]MEC4765774.1 hypothetical protein [Halomonas sp. CUBES01]